MVSRDRLKRAMWKEKNVLLTRDDIGRSKPSTYNLPNEGHAYGVKMRQEAYGVGKLTSEWHFPALSQAKIGEKNF